MSHNSVYERDNHESVSGSSRHLPRSRANADMAEALQPITALKLRLAALVQHLPSAREGDSRDAMSFGDPARGNAAGDPSTVFAQQNRPPTEVVKLDWRVLGRHESGVSVAVAIPLGCAPSWADITAALNACHRKLLQAHPLPEMVSKLPRVQEWPPEND